MIHLTSITRQHGSQILFRNASLQILPGTRTGLVGANGAGKTTIFRLIMGEEEADSGEISCARNTSIGYFSQDVGDMAGRSALQRGKRGQRPLLINFLSGINLLAHFKHCPRLTACAFLSASDSAGRARPYLCRDRLPFWCQSVIQASACAVPDHQAEV